MPATASINLRISNEEKALIDQAAQSLGKTRTDFILENSLRAAEAIILDRTRFTLSSEQWAAMNAALDTPPSGEQAQGLSGLLTAKAPWKKQ
ncbi:MAG: DUF1778 domain-containing protein [Desulfovibrionaceae bacterium]|nr:DUF1778 domain-containing protein [Desulfovibrionaceae bacterium]